MKPFKDFFQELYNPPSTYSPYGERGRSIWEEIVSEGIIHSYPSDKLKIALENIIPNSTINLRDGIIYLYAQESPVEDQSNDIQKIANGYGWVIVKNYFNDRLQHHVIVFEPNHPNHLTKEEIDEGNFYHITDSKYLEKINKIGLVPKISKTTFHHPGDRIYLLQIIDHNKSSFYIKQMKELLGKDTVLRIQMPSSWVIYQDPMFEVPSGLRACFVRKNIPPSFIRK
jgi:hypothetical protein